MYPILWEETLWYDTHMYVRVRVVLLVDVTNAILMNLLFSGKSCEIITTIEKEHDKWILVT